VVGHERAMVVGHRPTGPRSPESTEADRASERALSLKHSSKKRETEAARSHERASSREKTHDAKAYHDRMAASHWDRSRRARR